MGEDDRYLMVGGRRWRRQDPALPDEVAGRRERWQQALRALDEPSRRHAGESAE